MLKGRILCIALLGSSVLFAQKIPEKGVPWIDNYVPEQYNKHGKIWDIRSAPNGIVYLAGDEGLLEYDGINWNSFRGSKGYTRSLFLSNDSLLYSGSDLDFGVWKRNELQEFEYTSLYPFNDDANEENEEFWDVFQIEDKVLFVSFNNVYVYKNEQLTKIPAPSRFSGSFKNGDALYLVDEQNGLYELAGVRLKHIFDYPENTSFQINGVYENRDGLIIVTTNKGLYNYRGGTLSPWNVEVSSYLKTDQVFCSTLIDDTFLAFGTILNGVYITDLQGNIIQHFNKQKGLLNNTVLSIHSTANGMLWLGMDYGISAVHLYSSLSYFFDYQGEIGTAYCALLDKGTFYLGTNQGLYKTAWNQLDNNPRMRPFELVQGSEGQVWSLHKVNGDVLCGHDKGLYRVNGNFQRLHNEPGVWTMLPIGKGYLLTGNYNGLSLYRRSGNTYLYEKKLPLILGSCNQLLTDHEGFFWVKIPNFGVIRFSLNEEFIPENRKIFGAGSFEGNDIFLQKTRKGINLITNQFRYEFDPPSAEFIRKEPSQIPNQIRGLLSGIYEPIVIEPSHQFYPIHNGFALNNIKIGPEPGGDKAKVLVRRLEAFNNHDHQLFSADQSIPYTLNNLRFHFVVPHREDVVYQYQLEGYSDNWSEWSGNSSTDFLNLREGTYALNIKAQIDGAIVQTARFPFRISPPWFRSRLAIIAYMVLAILVYYTLREIHNYRMRKQRKAMMEREQDSLRKQSERYKQEVLIQQQEQLENEKKLLNQQITHKTIELAKQARENQNKNWLLHNLKEKIEEAQNDSSVSRVQLTEMKRLVDLYLESDDNTFEIQIDELHQEFFKKLREQYTDLSLYDLRLCAYLKIGLNSKEISEILHVLPSSINVSRSRLRKKLKLDQDEDLYVFLNSMH